MVDLDVGQPEFSVPGLLTLTSVTSPTFGPPYSHVVRRSDGEESGNEQLSARFMGDVTPRQEPVAYLRAALSLLAEHARLSAMSAAPIPLVINTLGWVKGMGLELLLELLRRSVPTHIVQMQWPGRADGSRNLPPLLASTVWGEDFSGNHKAALAGAQAAPPPPVPCFAPELLGLEAPQFPTHYASVFSVNCAAAAVAVDSAASSAAATHASWSGGPVQLGAKDSRALSQMAYFLPASRNTGDSDSESRNLPVVTPLVSQFPYCVHWNQVALHPHLACADVANEQLLFAFNGAIVGLLAADDLCDVDNDVDDARVTDVNGSGLRVVRRGVDVSARDCVGLGVLRAIDTDAAVYYVLTPVPPERLARVNVLAKGSMELPMVLLMQGSIGDGPYMTSHFQSTSASGAGARSTRRSVKRRKDAH